MGSGKPRGINAARKLRTVRVQNRWANKSYKKAHLGTQFKCNPFGGSSHCKGIVLEKMCAPPHGRAPRSRASRVLGLALAVTAALLLPRTRAIGIACSRRNVGG